MGRKFARIKKIDVPFKSDDEITQLVARFESCTWPYERWTHRAHIAIAALSAAAPLRKGAGFGAPQY
jgi:hypothetical protein